ncbi:hypothetical protein PHLCEN_2v7147 [Hermanssonia centrifuga]|uniref:DNA repair protein rhp7 treble clef domain-containing protein n=1 Tax=Hermanssonia centrifuga TaxID=98765 RepID=A0A2R6NXE5_9APHY|nr:hypothetical protein PHLCEN_2v7147 [Hermanssonia centrifuga]
MSRNRNNIRGPTSALTEFLKESGITPTTIARRVRTREVERPTAGPSTSAQQENGNEGNAAAEEYASDNLDETDTEPAPKKRKLTKAAEAKLKAQEKAKAKKGKKKGDDDGDYEDGESDEDAYTALPKMWKDQNKPPVGSFEDCAKCSKQFTVTKYTVAAKPPPGFLCHPCAKISGSDPFKKPAAPRKRKLAAEKRTVTHFEERRFPSLASMCVQVISRHIDDVEALGDIGSMNLDEIAKAISKDRSLTPENASIFYDVQHTNLTLYDATNLTPPALCTLASLNPNLTTLRLDFCGRMDNTVISAWSTSFPKLKRIELLGPFLVYAPAWQEFLKSHPDLEEFLITQSPRFDIACIEALVKYCKKISKLRLKEIGQMSDQFLQKIAKLGGQLTYLDLSYPGDPEALNEHVTIELMAAVGKNLTHLDLSNNLQLADRFLFQGLKPHTRRLNSLILSNLPDLTDGGVAELFDTWATTANPQNPPLATIDLSRNHELAGTALASLLKHSGSALEHLNINGWKDVPQDVLMAIPNQAIHLKRLDIGWCRQVDDWVVKGVIEKCEKIEEVKVFGCQRLTERCPRKRQVSIFGIESHQF